MRRYSKMAVAIVIGIVRLAAAQTGSRPSAAGWAAASSAAAQAVSAAFPAPSCGSMQVALHTVTDPSSGDQWQVGEDRRHPGGPGRMVRVGRQTGVSEECNHAAARGETQSGALIRAGDFVLIEEHTERADVRLHAVALGPARAGQRLAVRIIPGGSVIRVIAQAAGRARLASLEEVTR